MQTVSIKNYWTLFFQIKRMWLLLFLAFPLQMVSSYSKIFHPEFGSAEPSMMDHGNQHINTIDQNNGLYQLIAINVITSVLTSLIIISICSCIYYIYQEWTTQSNPSYSYAVQSILKEQETEMI